MPIPARYTRVAMLLHWLIAVLVITNVILSLITEQVPESRIRLLIDTHKSIGITVLGLMVLRLLWRASHAPPALPDEYPRWERRLALAAHAAFYVLLFTLPISGWMHDSAWKAAPEIPMHWFGLFEWPRIGWIMQLEPGLKLRVHGAIGQLHYWSGYLLAALVGLHVAAALKHQFRDRQRELQRMWS